MFKRFQPTLKAKFAEFTTLFDPKQMPGQRSRISSIQYPYVEGLRMDEAINPLSFMAVGVYGKTLPQNGAPLRLVVPWKYGFKSIKFIVKIRFTETMPKTTWVKSGSSEYGFYSNETQKSVIHVGVKLQNDVYPLLYLTLIVKIHWCLMGMRKKWRIYIKVWIYVGSIDFT